MDPTPIYASWHQTILQFRDPSGSLGLDLGRPSASWYSPPRSLGSCSFVIKKRKTVPYLKQPTVGLPTAAQTQ
ncbi:hypothetical protein TNCT_79981 [Trichonephila clavata]|uniref:Uncharacterized protein n=1 Tax=Trichonephila clavata TaxID=2740835 RepID=A0A8X6GL84_TRICU|nr:hypothetical protein TNCT_79981 [Trichonephila clavata]